MNTYELDTMTLNLLQLEISDNNRNQFSPIFTAAYNEAYMDICKQYIKPKCWEQVALTYRKFDVADLEFTPTSFIKAANNPDYSSDGGYSFQGGYEIKMYDSLQAVIPAISTDGCYILYEYLPETLVNDDPDNEVTNTSEPYLILGDARQKVLCIYATSVYYAAFKKPSMAEYFYERYLRSCENLSILSRQKITNKYM